MHLLLVEDATMLANAICAGVRQQRWSIDHVDTASAAKTAPVDHRYTAVLLHIGLAGECSNPAFLPSVVDAFHRCFVTSMPLCLGIGDWGLGIGDWGLQIADCRLQIADQATRRPPPFSRRDIALLYGGEGAPQGRMRGRPAHCVIGTTASSARCPPFNACRGKKFAGSEVTALPEQRALRKCQSATWSPTTLAHKKAGAVRTAPAFLEMPPATRPMARRLSA
ncbi:hypothetical protein [Xanthomonas campestris]|uniref:hypothetical protein n=1 Tax=Xanthomonas campestris TaxID=339 RepID=UPI0031B854E8